MWCSYISKISAPLAAGPVFLPFLTCAPPQKIVNWVYLILVLSFFFIRKLFQSTRLYIKGCSTPSTRHLWGILSYPSEFLSLRERMHLMSKDSFQARDLRHYPASILFAPLTLPPFEGPCLN